MKSLFIFLISVYQVVLSPVLATVFGSACRYEKTCSVYAKEAILEKGVLRGGKIALMRLLSCQPFSNKSYV
jgi:uncharacterized protein